MDASPLDAVPDAAKEIPVEKASHSVGLSSGIIFLISVVIQGIGLISTFFLSQTIGPYNSGKAVLGLVQFYLFIASSINNVGDLRIGAAFTFFISRGKPADESTGTYLVLRGGMVVAGAAALWAVSPFIRYSTPGGGSVSITANSTEMLCLGIFLLLPILWSISTVYTQLSVAQGRSVHGQIPLLLESVVRTGALVYVALTLPLNSPPTTAQLLQAIFALTLAYVPGAIVSAAYSLPRVLRYYTRFSRKETGAMFRFAWPLMGSLVLTWVATNAVGLYVVDLGGTGQYNLFNAANGFRILALAVPTAVIVPLFPSLSSLHSRGRIGQLRAQTFEALRYTAMFVVPAALCLVIYRVDFLATLTQGSYVVAATPLAILAASAIPAGLTMVIGTALNSVRLQRLELYLTSMQVAVLFGAALLLGPPVSLVARLGPNALARIGVASNGTTLTAAAFAVMASSLTALAVNTYFMERYMRVRIAVRPVVTITVAALAAFLAISRFNFLIEVHRFYVLFAAVVLGFVVYSFVLAALGELTKADVRRIGSMIRLPPALVESLARLCWREEARFPEPSDPLPPDGGGGPPEAGPGGR